MKKVHIFGDGLVKQVCFYGNSLVKQVHFYGDCLADGLVTYVSYVQLHRISL